MDMKLAFGLGHADRKYRNGTRAVRGGPASTPKAAILPNVDNAQLQSATSTGSPVVTDFWTRITRCALGVRAPFDST